MEWINIFPKHTSDKVLIFKILKEDARRSKMVTRERKQTT
jgi:hypothetical protein